MKSKAIAHISSRQAEMVDDVYEIIYWHFISIQVEVVEVEFHFCWYLIHMISPSVEIELLN